MVEVGSWSVEGRGQILQIEYSCTSQRVPNSYNKYSVPILNRYSRCSDTTKLVGDSSGGLRVHTCAHGAGGHAWPPTRPPMTADELRAHLQLALGRGGSSAGFSKTKHFAVP